MRVLFFWNWGMNQELRKLFNTPGAQPRNRVITARPVTFITRALPSNDGLTTVRASEASSATLEFSPGTRPTWPRREYSTKKASPSADRWEIDGPWRTHLTIWPSCCEI